ncbi:uncharacterized protein NECHADRAFT_84270 [Fusarium vanettenii 77-13-4]|uniref:Uncharacterized protein n=1 Tax=Fusarium vanettenii (strain ATCC MYA-4622 / CBS 123669 / FGSC 9596 / NRRL 45880 / 77-13-4) TaxID=660122 RepID=C7Z067_FUSV7|nr:uncharacterized protein NECHADRAFT_84270 [Fusarium vanettenii 77-13-4]EEU42733.1 predicted protein [Fusarium vanettenii 77-13-4]
MLFLLEGVVNAGVVSTLFPVQRVWQGHLGCLPSSVMQKLERVAFGETRRTASPTSVVLSEHTLRREFGSGKNIRQPAAAAPHDAGCRRDINRKNAAHDLDYNDQKRTLSIPTADQIRAVFKTPGLLRDVCKGTWRVGDEQQLQNTFNHGCMQRADSSKPLRRCMEAFEDIIAQCIEGAGFWGGSWGLDGELNNISNSNYPHNPLLPGDDGGPSSLEPNIDPCEYPKHHPAALIDSGAAQYLEDFLAIQGDDNWLFEMEHDPTNGQGTAQLPSCGVIEAANCSPSKGCREYTSTEFFYIRFVSGLINQLFTRAHEKLQDETILNILAIDEIIADFKPDPANAVDPNIFNTMAGALTMAGAVSGAAPGPAGDILNLFGGVMTIVGANIPAPEVLDIEAVRSQASAHLRTIFDETRNSMANLLARLFGNTDVEYSLLELVDGMKSRGFQPVSDAWDPTAVILSMPWMGESESVDLTDSLAEGVRFMNQGLVGVTLKAMGYLVMMIKNYSESECSEIEGSQYIDNYCYAMSTGSRGLSYKFMSAEDIKLLPQKYGIDMAEFFKNIRECRTLSDNHGVSSHTTMIPLCLFIASFLPNWDEACRGHGEVFRRQVLSCKLQDGETLRKIAIYGLRVWSPCVRAGRGRAKQVNNAVQ